MIGWPPLPYELIGKAMTVVGAVVLLVAAALAIVVLFLFMWFRALDFLTMLLWRGYIKEGRELPPKWRLELSFYVQAIKNFDLSMVETFRENAYDHDPSNEE